jgi:hypothetical protein
MTRYLGLEYDEDADPVEAATVTLITQDGTTIRHDTLTEADARNLYAALSYFLIVLEGSDEGRPN